MMYMVVYSLGFPYMRGDGPTVRVSDWMYFEFSLHAWGWTAPGGIGKMITGVFPTCVGMDRSGSASQKSTSHFPYMRWDGPSR